MMSAPTLECCGRPLGWVLPAGCAPHEARCESCGNVFLWMPRRVIVTDRDTIRLTPSRRRLRRATKARGG